MNNNTNLNRIGNLLVPNGIELEVNLNFNNNSNGYNEYINQNQLLNNYIENDSDDDFEFSSDEEYREYLNSAIEYIRNDSFNNIRYEQDISRHNYYNIRNELDEQNSSRHNYYNIRNNLNYIMQNNQNRIDEFNNLANMQNNNNQQEDDIEFTSFEEYINENIQTNPEILNNKLKKLKKYKCKEDANCTICLEKISKNTEIYKLECKHNFHSNCLEDWLKEKLSCPICRKNI
jgi:hypothetical protein